jgi:hypothetical protein
MKSCWQGLLYENQQARPAELHLRMWCQQQTYPEISSDLNNLVKIPVGAQTN